MLLWGKSLVRGGNKSNADTMMKSMLNFMFSNLSGMSGGAKRKTVPAKLDLTEEQKSDIKEAFR